MANTSYTCHASVARTVTIGLLAVAGLTPGCDGRPPTAPPPPPAPRSAPVVTALSESLGSTGGGAEVRIEGTGFLDFGNDGGLVVTFGGVLARIAEMSSTAIVTTVPAHEAGLVDVVVLNPDGQSGRLAGGYTYASPDTFDLNGEWEGRALRGEVLFRFSIRNNTLTAMTCDTSGSVDVLPAPSVAGGEFSFTGTDGVAVSGRFVSPTNAIGLATLAPCVNFDWVAGKKS